MSGLFWHLKLGGVLWTFYLNFNLFWHRKNRNEFMSSSELGLPARAGSSSSQVGFLTTNMIPWFWPSLSHDKNIWVAPLWCSNMSVMISIFERVKTFHPRITHDFPIEITWNYLFGGYTSYFQANPHLQAKLHSQQISTGHAVGGQASTTTNPSSLCRARRDVLPTGKSLMMLDCWKPAEPNMYVACTQVLMVLWCSMHNIRVYMCYN